MTEIDPLETRKLKIAFIGARGVVGTYSGIETYYEEIGFDEVVLRLPPAPADVVLPLLDEYAADLIA